MSKVSNAQIPTTADTWSDANSIPAATVQLGETTLPQVARRLNLDPVALLRANPQIADPDNLKAGQDIRLPDAIVQSPLPAPAADLDGGTAPAMSPTLDEPRRFERDLGGNMARALFDMNFGKMSAGPAEGGLPDAKNLGELAADKVAERINERLTHYPPGKIEQYPQLSNEEQAAADVGLGLAKYKEEADYARKLLEYAKVLPDGPLKQQVLAKLGPVADHLGKISDVLGKAGKLVKDVQDVIGFAQSMGELADNLKKWSTGNPDPQAVLDVIDSFGKVNDRAQGMFDQFGSWLMKQGTEVGSKGAMVLAFATSMLKVGIEAGKAGVKAEKAYIDRMKRTIDEIDRLAGHPRVKESEIQLPPAPAPLRTYAQLRSDERALNLDMVASQVRNAYMPERTAIKEQFYQEHDAVHKRFDQEGFPKIYIQHRSEIMNRIRQIGTSEDLDLAKVKSEVLTMMENNGSRPTGEQIQNEIRLLARVEQHYLNNSPSVRPGVGEERKVLDRLAGGEYQSRGPGIDSGIQKLYTAELEKFYEKNGVGVEALDKRYAERGVSDQDIGRRIAQEVRRLGL